MPITKPIAASINQTDGTIPVAKDGIFIDSPFTVIYDAQDVATDIISSVPLTVPSGTVAIGGILNEDGTILRGVTELKDSGKSFLASDNVTGKTGTVPIAIINDSEDAPVGVGKLTSVRGNTFSYDSFGGTDTDSVTVSGTDKIIVSFREVLPAYLTRQKFRGTQGKMHYRIIDTTSFDGKDSLVYTSEQGAPIDFDSAVAPDFEIEYFTVNPNFLIQDHLLRLEFFSADGEPMTMRGFPTSLPIPPVGSGDVTNFVPFFETYFSVTEDRTIYHNDRAVDISSDFNILGSFKHMVNTTSSVVTLTADKDDCMFFDVIDAKGSFNSNNCVVNMLDDNVRLTPNDSITLVEATQVECSSVDSGVSGVKNAFSFSASPVIYNNGTNWVVVTDQETLDFTEVTDRTGLLFFRILGSKGVLTVGDNTQEIDGISGTYVSVDAVGSTSDSIDSITGSKLYVGDSIKFDDKVIALSVTLSKNNSDDTFWYDGVSWNQVNNKFDNPYREDVFDDLEIVTNSTTYNDVLQNDFTVPEDGFYKLGVTYKWRHRLRNRQQRIRVRIDGVEQTDITAWHYMGGANNSTTTRELSSYWTLVNLTAGSHDIDMQMSSEQDNAYIYDRRIFLESYK